MFDSVRTLACLVGLAALAGGCRDKPKKQEPPKTAEAPGSGASSAFTITLPKGPGTPPQKTAKPLVRADFDRLAKLEFPQFQMRLHGESDKLVEIRQQTTVLPRIMTTITIEPCEQHTLVDCRPLQLATWKDDPKLKSLLGDRLINFPDLEFEVGETELAGERMIYAYQLGAKQATQGEGGAFTNAYALYWNDGTNSIRVVTRWADDPTDKETARAKAPKQDLERFAKAFMDVYTHAWAATS